MNSERTMQVIIALLFVTLIGFVLSYTSVKGNFDEVAAMLEQCNQSRGEYSEMVDGLFVDIDACFTSAEGLGTLVDNAQEQWGYWMSMAEGYKELRDTCWVRLELMCDGCYPE